MTMNQTDFVTLSVKCIAARRSGVMRTRWEGNDSPPYIPHTKSGVFSGQPNTGNGRLLRAVCRSALSGNGKQTSGQSDDLFVGVQHPDGFHKHSPGFFLGVNGLFRHPACLLSEKNKTVQIEEPFNLHRHDSDPESSRGSFRKMGTTIQARQSLHDLDALLLNHMEHGVM